MRGLILAVVTVGTLAADAGAQIPLPTGPTRQDSARADTVPVPRFRIEPPTSPLAAFGRSLLLPGWGQAVMGRRVTGAVFVFWEGLTLTMYLKSLHQLGYLKRVGETERAEGKRQEIQDWFALLVFNHLMAGAEAFVSAQLWDFPVELDARVLPGGRTGIGARVPLPD